MPTRAATPRTAAPTIAPIIILSGSCGPPSDACAIAHIADELFDHHPCQLQQWECDEANHGRRRHESFALLTSISSSCASRLLHRTFLRPRAPVTLCSGLTSRLHGNRAAW